MKILYSWLLDYVPYRGTPQELGVILTDLGLSVESLTQIGAEYSGVLVGKVLTCEPLVGSDHLSHCTVDVAGNEILPIVCGASNVSAGQVVPVAVPGAILPGGFEITQRKLRGVLSKGMICSERELGISNEHKGILVLPDTYELGRKVQDYLGEVDWLFDLEVTFNRPDCLSHLGVAREIAAKVGLDLNRPEVTIAESTEETSKYLKVKILDPVRAPRYSGRIVRGATVGPSPEWMQKRLSAVGIRPISNIVDVTNYIMMELGHPLHAFDYHLVQDGQIIVRMAEAGEKFVTLDSKEHTLSTSDLLIADSKKGIALAGVMGGLNSEINDNTKDVIIECAVFKPTGIRITSRDHGIGSESSRRFERGVDPEQTITAASRAAYLIQQLAGGEVLRGTVDEYPNPWKVSEISIRSKRVNDILASDLTAVQMRSYLSALSCKQTAIMDGTDPSDSSWKVYPPSWRRDLEREIDLIEEIIRLHGYNEVALATRSHLPLEPDALSEHKKSTLYRIKTALVSLGLNEAICWSLISTQDDKHFVDGNQSAKVINPLSEDISRLRRSLAPGLMRSLERNLNAGTENVRLFESGKCFRMQDNVLVEYSRIGVILTGNVRPVSYADASRALGYPDVRGVVEQFFKKMNISIGLSNDETVPQYFSMGLAIHTEELSLPIGVFGQITTETCSNFGIDIPVWYIEIDGDALLQLTKRTPRYIPLPRFPAATRDLAFIVDTSTAVGGVLSVLREKGGEILENIDLFDIYSGKGIDAGKKSLAFHLSFRHLERTLSDGEVDRTIKSMIEAARNLTGAELRSN